MWVTSMVRACVDTGPQELHQKSEFPQHVESVAPKIYVPLNHNCGWRNHVCWWVLILSWQLEHPWVKNAVGSGSPVAVYGMLRSRKFTRDPGAWGQQTDQLDVQEDSSPQLDSSVNCADYVRQNWWLCYFYPEACYIWLYRSFLFTARTLLVVWYYFT